VTYDECIDYLLSRLPMFHRTGAAAYKPGIGNITELCELVGNPHVHLRFIHIAGTNGKGSTAHLIASVLQEAGYTTALHTSPHLTDFRERFRINGKMIPREEVVTFVELYKDRWEKVQPSFFEIGVALAFWTFLRASADICVMETGLGGRLDSTNIIQPELSVITPIGMDHMNLLGDTIEDIAREKAGIIKSGIPVVISRQHNKAREVLVQQAVALNAPLVEAEATTDQIPDHTLRGKYQQVNARTALTALHQLIKQGWKIDDEAIQSGFANVVANTGLRGRWEILCQAPLIVCDVGHNEDGIVAVMDQVAETPHHTLHIVLGVVHDKDINRMIIRLSPTAIYYFCKADIPRGMDADELASRASGSGLRGNVFPSVADAFHEAVRNAAADDLVLVTGSFFTVAEVLSLPAYQGFNG